MGSQNLIACCLLLSASGCDLTALGERHYAVPAFDPEISDQFILKPDSDWNGSAYSALAYRLKNISDINCAKFKTDLTLSQTGDNFLADVANALLGFAGAVVGGGTARVTSAAVGAVTGVKGAINDDIFGKFTDVVSNYIDTARDEQWLVVQNKLKLNSAGRYSSDAEVFNDVLIYHNRCSLARALATAAKESGNKKLETDQAVARNATSASPINIESLKFDGK